MKPQVQPDWTLSAVTKDKIEEQLTNFKFEGPGFYLKETETILISVAEEVEQSWKKNQPEVRIYDIHIYNVSFRNTIFSSSLIPTRKDDRN